MVKGYHGVPLFMDKAISHNDISSANFVYGGYSDSIMDTANYIGYGGYSDIAMIEIDKDGGYNDRTITMDTIVDQYISIDIIADSYNYGYN